jgi:hypothetical protein
VKGCGVWLVNATLLPQGPTPNDAFPTSDFGFKGETTTRTSLTPRLTSPIFRRNP